MGRIARLDFSRLFEGCRLSRYRYFIKVTCFAEPDHFDSGPYPASNVKGGFISIFTFSARYSTLLHLPPLRFHSVGGFWIEPRTSVSDPYSFFTDPDPEDPDGGQSGSGSNPDPGL